MPVDFVWDDAEKTVIRYRALGTWNWSDYHKMVRISTFHLDTLDHSVDTLFDLTGSTRMPAGAVGHLRMLGKADHAHRRPRAIIIGADETLQTQLGAVAGVYRADGQLLQFVADEAEAQAVLAAWRA